MKRTALSALLVFASLGGNACDRPEIIRDPQAQTELADGGGSDEGGGSTDTLSLGGDLNLGIWDASLGLGYDHTIGGDRQLNDQTGDTGHFVHQTVWEAV